MIFDAQLILGGYLLQFMVESDIELLQKYIEDTCSFNTPPYEVSTSTFGDRSPMVGAALSLIEKYIATL